MGMLVLGRVYWLVDRDSYHGLLQSLYNWLVFHPLYNPTNQVFFVAQIFFIFTPTWGNDSI